MKKNVLDGPHLGSVPSTICSAKMIRGHARVVLCLAGLLSIFTSLTGCESSDKLDELTDKLHISDSSTTTENENNIADTETTDAVSAPTPWPAYYAPTFFGHGYPSENTDREAAIAAAQAAGMDCIRVNCPTPPSDEVAMHLLHFKSPVDGHFLHPSWYDNALSAGVTRWIIDIGNGEEFSRWRFLTKDYPENTLQWIVNGAVVAQ